MFRKYYIKDKDFFTNEEDKEKTVIYTTDENKKSTMTLYHILPGIELIYNSYNSKETFEPIYTPYSKNLIEINHCRQGRYGCVLENNRYIYLGTGEIEANIMGIDRKTSEFPLGFYEGISILVDVSIAKQSLLPMFPDIVDELEQLKTHLENNDDIVLINKVPELEHVFNEIYSVKSEIRMSYIKIKVLEVLLMLQAVPFDRTSDEKKYYSKGDMDKVKAIHQLITGNLQEKFTIKDLAEEYCISSTQLKNCFKEVYGMPFYSYIKHYKMHKAVHYLEDSDLSINDIAGQLGYNNSSKFISAFKSILNCTPNRYKKENVPLEHLRLFGVEIED